MFVPYSSPIKDGETVSFKFDGEFEGIDLANFTKVVTCYSQVVAEAAAIEAPGLQLNCRIHSLTPGCLDAAFGFVASGLSILSATAGGPIEVIERCVLEAGKVVSLFRDVSRHGGASSVSQRGGDVTITANDGNTIECTVNNYLLATNDATGKLVRGMAKSVTECDGVTGLSIAGSGDPGRSIDVTTRDLAGMAKLELPELEPEQELIDTMTLELVSPVYDNSRPWKFRLIEGNGHVSLAMEDAVFASRLEAMDTEWAVGPHTLMRMRVRWEYRWGKTNGGRKGRGAIVEVLKVIRPD